MKGYRHMDNSKEPKTYYEQKPNFSGMGHSKLWKHFGQGLTIFLVIAACILFYFAILRAGDIFAVFEKIFGILKPIIYGFVIAYLLNPIVKYVEQQITPKLSVYVKKEQTRKKLGRSIGVVLALVVAVALVVTLCNMVIPELYKSIRDLIFTLPDQMNEWVDKVNKMLLDNTTLDTMIKNVVNQGSETLENWLKTDLLKQTNILMSNLTLGVINVVSGVMNIIIGIIVSVYVLFSKEQFAAQCKKMIYACMTPEHANMAIHITKKSHEIFGGFIIGKIIDSAIIGVLCFACLSLMNMPYTLLVSVIVGVTNVIPFFGPYIGAIPSAILIMLADPMKGIYFIVFILILQQVDGNIIGPKILGNSTGLSAFWVVFSILLGGGLFGFIGMIMGVPTFAVIYYIVQMVINQKLENKKLPTETAKYNYRSYVDNDGKYVSVTEEKTEKEKEE